MLLSTQVEWLALAFVFVELSRWPYQKREKFWLFVGRLIIVAVMITCLVQNVWSFVLWLIELVKGAPWNA